MKKITINQALDIVLELKQKMRNSNSDISEIQNLTDVLLNKKIDLGGRTILDETTSETYHKLVEKNS